MIQDFIFYSFLLGALAFFVTWLLAKRDKGIAGIVTAIVGFVVVVFVFPSPQPAADLTGLLDNAGLFVAKLLYVVSWGGAALILSFVLP